MHSPNPLPRIIGLTGRAGVGKDTLADYLVLAHGYAKYSLASPLKNGLSAMFGFTPDEWLDRDWKEREIPWLGKSPRQLAQTLGTEWGRQQVASDLWLRCAKQFIDRLPADQGVVISDVRFDNEALFLRGLGGVIAQISRPGTASVAAHASEAGVSMPLVDCWIANTGVQADLGPVSEYLLRDAVAADRRLPPTPEDHHFS